MPHSSVLAFFVKGVLKNPFQSVSSLFISLTLLLVALYGLVSLMVQIVPQSEEWMLERFGRFDRTLPAGLHFTIPLVHTISSRVSLRERVLDIPPQDIITKDNAMVTVDGVVFYKVVDSVKAAYQVSHMELAIAQLTLTNIRTAMGGLELDHLLSNREGINAKLLTEVDEATDPWGIKIIRIEIKDIKPPKDLQQAMGRQLKAEREKRALILESEGIRQSEINRAEGKKQANILVAEGNKQARILAAEAEKEQKVLQAQAREREAEAEGKAITTIMEGDKKAAADYLLALKSIASLQKLATAKNQKTLLLPFGAGSVSNVVGAMTGLAQLGKELMSDQKKGKNHSNQEA